jgi:hypothetical protein
MLSHQKQTYMVECDNDDNSDHLVLIKVESTLQDLMYPKIA